MTPAAGRASIEDVRPRRVFRLALIACLLAPGCASKAVERASPATGQGGIPPASPGTASTATTRRAEAPVAVVLRLERRTGDPETAGFAAVVEETLTDPRGWQAAGFAFSFRDDAPYRVVLAEGPEVDRLCRPYDVGGRYSCQNGPVVALNADRWRQATPKWTGDLATYRRMLVNHEVGHLLGQHHPAVHCPRPGQPAPVMTQQSTELDGCLPNPWPLPWEVACAARHDEPVAPGYTKHAVSRCRPA